MATVTLDPGDFRSPRDLVSRERRAKALRDSDIGQAYLCYEQAAPGANPYLHGYNADPQARREAGSGRRGAVASEVGRVYSSQLQTSVKRFVDRVMAELFPDGSEWASLQPGDSFDEETAFTADEAKQRREEADDLATMLEPIQRHAFQDLHRSSFSEEAPQALMDAVIWRVGVLRVRATDVDEGVPSAVDFEHVSQAECAFEWGPGGKCWGVYRQHWLTREEAEHYWPDGSGWDFPAEGEEGEPAHRTFLECTYKVRGKRRWAYQVIQIEDADARECYRAGFDRNPYVVFGVNGAPGGILTRSIVEVALATARSLNTMVRITLQAAEFRATPTYTVAQGGLPNSANLSIRPGIVIPVKSNEHGNPSLQRLDVGGDVDLGWASEERMSQQVQTMCYDEALPPDRPQPKTATEVMEIVRQFRNTLGSIFSRLMSQLGVEVLQHVLDALYARKEIHGMEREGGQVSVIELDGKQVKVTFQNTLAQAQRMSDVEDVIGAVESLNSIMPPEMVASSVNLERIPEYVGKQLSLPEWFWRPEKQRQPLAEQATQTLVAGGAPSPGAGVRPGPDAAGASAFAQPRGVQAT